ncbi:MAG: MBL fold metallo-hydrolase, partial [Microvirga sp.]
MSVTRRTILAGTALAITPSFGETALAQSSPAAPSPAAPSPAAANPAGQSPSTPQAPGFYRYKVGDIEVTAVNDGFARRPVDGLIRNAPIEDVRQAMAEAFLPDDILPITFTGLVLRQGDRLTVIDTGNGEFGGPTSGNWL